MAHIFREMLKPIVFLHNLKPEALMMGGVRGTWIWTFLNLSGFRTMRFLPSSTLLNPLSSCLATRFTTPWWESNKEVPWARKNATSSDICKLGQVQFVAYPFPSPTSRELALGSQGSGKTQVESKWKPLGLLGLIYPKMGFFRPFLVFHPLCFVDFCRVRLLRRFFVFHPLSVYHL